MRLALTTYSDYICPFCFLHGEVLRVLEEPEALDVRWVCVEIHPETAAEGCPLTREGAYARKWDGFIAPFAEEHNMPLDFPRFLPNTRQAILATALADHQGRGRAFHDRTMHAYWREQQNIGDPAVLLELAAEVGVEVTDAAAWQTAESAATVARDHDAALEDMATGFPTTMLGQFPLMGLQSPRDMRTHLDRYRRLRAKQQAHARETP